MIRLSNGHHLEFVVTSGALGFDGRGYFWEWPLRWASLIDSNLFTISIRTILVNQRPGNFRWYVPWQTVKFLSEKGETINPVWALLMPSKVKGLDNAIGLRNPGFLCWLEKHYPVIENLGYKIIVSITGKNRECIEMAKVLEDFKNVTAIELNPSCPNVNSLFLENAETIISLCCDIKGVCELPLILKLSYPQPYVEIAKRLEGIVEAISINSILWRVVFRDKPSPLSRYGGGAVSGKIIQPFIRKMVKELSSETSMPVIGSSIWDYEDISVLEQLGASAFSFGSIFMRWPWKPTSYVRRWRREN